MTALFTLRSIKHFVAGILIIAGLGNGFTTHGAESVPKITSPWAPFVEPEFPFFSAALDARRLGPGWPTNNLTPRGIILNVGEGFWVCFDSELLRIAAIWEGKGITPVGMAQGSYHNPGHKASEGQEKLPQIIGTPWLANGIYPGWQEEPRMVDPREPGPDPREVGRGPLPRTMGIFKNIHRGEDGAVLEYEVFGVNVRERMRVKVVDGTKQIEREFNLAKLPRGTWLVVGQVSTNVETQLVTGNDAVGSLVRTNEVEGVMLKPSRGPVKFAVVLRSRMTEEGGKSDGAKKERPTRKRVTMSASRMPASPLWPEMIRTKGTLAESKGAFVLDQIALPLDNPWKRNVRLADLAFFPDGTAAAVTFDGDVWQISGLSGDLREVRWQRFASGLHEPLSICVRDREIFVYDRNGIWNLRDTNGDGEADDYRLFSNVFAQTAETREFVTGMRVAPDGSFVISKGGQEGSTAGKLNGTVLRVSKDGKLFKSLGWGLRQPFIGVHPRTGMVTASDQQGHYVPATPLYILENNRYYGFLPSFAPKEQYPAEIAAPLTWVPHSVNASAASQVWVNSDRMGPLNDALIYFGYTRPEIFLVRLNNRGMKPQAAVTSLTQDLDFAPLNGAINPRDGQLYVTGFQIWGTTAKNISGLARLRHTKAPSFLPREVAATDKGILLRFDIPLEAATASNPANYSIERWNYKRTANYGSPHFKLDGKTGQDWMTPSSAYVSLDHKSVFIGVPDMKPGMQMRVGLALTSETGKAFANNAYFTPHELTDFRMRAEGFKATPIDLTPRMSSAAKTEVTVEEGKKLSNLMGCVACHSTDGSMAGKVGPTWKGLFGAERTFKDGEPAVADVDYLRESMLEPTAKIVSGFEKNDTGMPSYAGVLTEAQIQALILYIQTLK